MKSFNVLLLVLNLVAMIFAATSIALPWWSLSLSTEAKTILNSNFRVDYGLLKTVSTAVVSQANNQSMTIGLANLTSQDDPNADSFRFMDTTLVLVVAGLVLSVPLVIVMIIPQLHKYRKYMVIIGYLSSAILLVSSLYFVSQMVTPVSKLSSLTPIRTPTDWVTINPADIAGAWGSKAIPPASPLLAWASFGSFWVWQPSLGWYLAFSSSLLIALASLVLRLDVKLEEKQEITQAYKSSSEKQTTPMNR